MLRFAHEGLPVNADEQLIFPQTVEGLFVRGLASKMSPELKGRLREEGLDLERPLAAGYPAERFARWVRIASEVLYPGLPEEQALRRVGRHFFSGYMDTLMGKALAPLMRVLGPRRTLERMERNFRSGSNYIAVRTEAAGPTEMVLHFNDVHRIPGYFAGVIEQGAEVTGAKGTIVEVLPAPAPGCALRVRWRE
nr:MULTISPECIES: DUF2378 family protein [Myxococcaceae]